MTPITRATVKKTAVHHRNGLSAFPLGDDLLLFSEVSGNLFRANPMAALIWNGLSSGLERQELIDLLCEMFTLSPAQVAHDLDSIFALWQTNGLVTANRSLPATPKREPHDFPSNLNYSNFSLWQTSEGIETRYRLLDSRVGLRLPDEQTALLVHPIMAHLAVPDPETPNVLLEVRRDLDNFFLFCDGVPTDWCIDAQGVAPMIHANLHLMAYERGNHLAGVHAAAVVYQNSCILLPAPPGSGKSTLTAALVGCGFVFCSDDMVFLTRRPVKLRTAPLAMGIKSGSWEVLAKHFPQLSSLACHERADGQKIRYLPPPCRDPINTTEAVGVTHIIFPAYRNGHRSTLTPISPAEGLCRITQAGYDVPGGLSGSSVAQLVDWIAGIPCYDFQYGDLDDAVDCIKACVA